MPIFHGTQWDGELAVGNLAGAPRFRVVNLAAKLKRQISDANLTWLQVPPPCVCAMVCMAIWAGRWMFGWLGGRCA